MKLASIQHGGRERVVAAVDDDESLGLPFGGETSPAQRGQLACEAYQIPDGLGPRSGQTLGGLSTIACPANGTATMSEGHRGQGAVEVPRSLATPAAH